MEDFVSMNIIEKLKEKGYPIKHYTEGKFGLTELKEVPIAPTIYQVLKWLREEKKIHICIDFDKDMNWYYQIAIYDSTDIASDGYGFKSYEDAVLAGIEYVLDNII